MAAIVESKIILRVQLDGSSKVRDGFFVLLPAFVQFAAQKVRGGASSIEANGIVEIEQRLLFSLLQK